jgi:Asp-tRNA(Asn)/Glu-tRNA(Gln) amidotransferase C subunit
MSEDIIKNFTNTLMEFLDDLEVVFPEYASTLRMHKENVVVNPDYYLSWFEKINEKYFLEISTKDETIFSAGSEKLEFLPGLDFKLLWKCNISKNTRNAIWKYLHVLLLLVFNHNFKGKTLNDTFEEWNNMLDGENVDEEKLKQMKEQTEKVFKLMQNLASQDTEDDVFEDDGKTQEGGLPQFEEELRKDPFMKKLEKSKIAKLAEELAGELKIDDIASELSGGSDTSMDEILKKLGKDPKQIMNLVKSVGNKIQDKLSSGNISQEDLISEAQDLISSMKDSKAFKKMFKKAGKNGNLNPMDLFNMLSKQFGEGGGDMEDMMRMMNTMGPMSAPRRNNNPTHSASATQERLRKKLEKKRMLQNKEK